jgi:osmotically-inducible protein OsmY
MPTFILAGAIGAAIAYLFDPQNGRRRRKMAADRAGALFRSTGRSAAQAGRGVASQAQGAAQAVKHRDEEPKELDDVTLARKVETEIFRDAEVPKGQINVNVEDGVVYLRGEVERDLIEDLAQKTRSVQGVLGVENLLHAPGEPAPAKPE